MADVKIKVGDRVRRKIEYGLEGGIYLPAEEGVVVYVHPQGRFYTVEYTFPGKEPGTVRTFRESYPLNETKD